MRILFSILLMLSAAQLWAAPVGEIAMLKGSASIVRGDKNIAAKVQLPIMAKDIIHTYADGKVQLLFADNTVITLGSNTRFEIDDYWFDAQNSRANFDVRHGKFKVITGRIGKLAPKSFLLKTKTSLIGIRGTIFAGDVGVTAADGSGDLLACLKGSISVQSLTNHAETILNNGSMIFVDDSGNLGNIEAIDPDSLSVLSSVKGVPQLNDATTSVPTTTAPTEATTEPQDATPQPSQSSNVDDVDDDEREEFDNLGKLHHRIAEKTQVEYQGKLKGTSNATITTQNQGAKNTLKLKGDVSADMNMQLDFGGNNPLKIDIRNQQNQLTEVTKNGTKIDTNAANALLNTVDGVELSDQMILDQQNIDANVHTLDASGSRNINGLQKDVTLHGQFTDRDASQLKGSLKEHAQGALGAGNRTLERTIDATFDVKQKD